MPKDLAIGLNFEMALEQSKAPEWIQLLPGDPVITGKDGREWVNDDPAAVVAASMADGPLPVDEEHATEQRAPKGESAPAVGWIEEMVVKEGNSVWGRVNWTAPGRALVEGQAYRFVSPVFYHSLSTKKIVAIDSVGLTNRPNLRLRALNRKEHSMGWEKVLAALGLAKDATPEAAVPVVESLKSDLAIARNRADVPDLAKFVPRADFDLVKDRAEKAENRVRDIEKAQADAAIEEAVAAAVKAGKVTPAAADYHKAACRQDGGLDRFKSFVESAPVIAPESGLGAPTEKEAPGKLTDEQKAVNRMLGISQDDFEKYGKGAA